LVWLIVIGAVVVVGGGGALVSGKRSARRRLELAQAKVMPYYDRLANELNTLDPKDNSVARQALADASERFTSAGSTLAIADTVEKYGIMRQTVLEGLYAARSARVALGIDPGPALPAADEIRGEQLTAPRQIMVRGQQFDGFPSYRPGAAHYYGGGLGIPGGWYATPFWQLGGTLAVAPGGVPGAPGGASGGALGGAPSGALGGAPGGALESAPVDPAVVDGLGGALTGAVGGGLALGGGVGGRGRAGNPAWFLADAAETPAAGSPVGAILAAQGDGAGAGGLDGACDGPQGAGAAGPHDASGGLDGACDGPDGACDGPRGAGGDGPDGASGGDGPGGEDARADG